MSLEDDLRIKMVKVCMVLVNMILVMYLWYNFFFDENLSV